MLRIKRLYLFMLQSFLPLFLMTFFICLFIVLMQFLWRFVDDLVGKGLEFSVLCELFFYAALTMVPMALPLAILLASLMTFGNLGERFELMAMKASGISLLKVMRPLIVLMFFIAVGAFFFQNNILPVAQVKMYSLLWSVKQKSPELEIPEGVFYDQIAGYNFFVERKDKETGTLHSVMIYDVAKGNDIDQLKIILADSGRISVTEDKANLLLTLYHGEQFDNMRGQGSNPQNIPYRRESFTLKEILIPFDNDFNRMDESGMRNQYVGKNISELRHTIDSVTARVDSIGAEYADELKNRPYFNLIRFVNKENAEGETVREYKNYSVPKDAVLPFDSIFSHVDPSMEKSVALQALEKARRLKQDYEYRGYVIEDDNSTIRKHEIELQKKFTLSIACIIFFFIGAPLGAIIRKGGIGTPIVISVILFIIYYIIDNSGYKLARDGRWMVWEGIWLSTAVLLPLGIFLTYKAINDSAVLNSDAYLNFFRRLFGITEVRHVEMKEVAMEDVVPEKAMEYLHAMTEQCRNYAEVNKKKQSYISFFLEGYDRSAFMMLANNLDELVEYLSNSQNKLLVNKLGDYPILRNLWFYNPTPAKAEAWVAIIFFPIGLALWLLGRKFRAELHSELDKIIKLDIEIGKLVENE